jgi:hypothetical protein
MKLTKTNCTASVKKSFGTGFPRLVTDEHKQQLVGLLYVLI